MENSIITFKGNGRKYIYEHMYGEYLRSVIDKLKKKYTDFKYNIIIELKCSSIGLLDIYVTVCKKNNNGKIIDGHTNYAKGINVCAGPIEIELAITLLLINNIYATIPNLPKSSVKVNDDIKNIWSLNINIANTNCVYSKIESESITKEDIIRGALNCYKPLFVEQINHLKRSIFLCYDNDTKMRMLKTVCCRAIDLILEKCELESALEKLEQFDIKITQSNETAFITLKAATITDSKAEFTVKYTDDFNNPLEIPDPSNAIAKLVLSFFYWYLGMVEPPFSTPVEVVIDHVKDSISFVINTDI